MPACPARPSVRFVACFGLLVAALPAWAAAATRVTEVRLWSGPEGTRLVLDLSGPVRYDVFAIENPDRIVIDLDDADLAAQKGLPAGQGPVKAVRSGPQPGHDLRHVLDPVTPQKMKAFMVGPDGPAGHRLVVEMPSAASQAAPGGGAGGVYLF